MGIKKRYSVVVVVVVVAYYYYQVRVASSIASTVSISVLYYKIMRKKGKNFASTTHAVCTRVQYAVLTYMLHVHIFIYLPKVIINIDIKI